MKLYTYPGAPNPLRVELLIEEKGLDIPKQMVDVVKGEQLEATFLMKNPNADVPVLELDSGQYISQVPAICLYLEEHFPEFSLYGSNSEQKAEVIMWEHLAFINGLLSVADILRNTSKGLVNRSLVGPHNYAQIPELAVRGRQRVGNFFADLNARLECSEYVAGTYFSMADITAWVSCNFATWVKEEIRPEQQALKQWFDNIALRPAFITCVKS